MVIILITVLLMGWALFAAVAHDDERYWAKQKLVMQAAEDKRQEVRRAHNCHYIDEPKCLNLQGHWSARNCGCYWDDLHYVGEGHRHPTVPIPKVDCRRGCGEKVEQNGSLCGTCADDWKNHLQF
jgi:hypothetical protein